MSVETYFQRYAFPKTWIESPPSGNLELIIAIPVYKETSIVPTLKSLYDCNLPPCSVEVLIIINEPANAPAEVNNLNSKCFDEAIEWSGVHNTENLTFHIIKAYNLSQKDHGVGLARKIGMDEALRRITKAGNLDKGIIACFDADSSCSANYMEALHLHFGKHLNCPGVSIYYEHDLNAVQDLKLLSGIIQYELHLRYYILAQRYAGFPQAFHTVGSSIAVKAETYYKQGGMNKRKAGEDFYFLHKFISLGGFMDLPNTIVFPAARVSDRVPFGTGRALSDWMKGTSSIYYTYNPQSFQEVRELFLHLKDIYYDTKSNNDFPPAIRDFLKMESFTNVVNDIKLKTRDYLAFKKRFYNWFNGFKMMKYLHFSRDRYYKNISVGSAASWLLKNYRLTQEETTNPKELLELFRKIDKKGLNKVHQ